MRAHELARAHAVERRDDPDVQVASPVFALYGQSELKVDEMPQLQTPLVRDARAYHIHAGNHNLTPYDWQRYMDFADGLWRRTTPTLAGSVVGVTGEVGSPPT